jgi:DNA-binding NtrC family response regulator
MERRHVLLVDDDHTILRSLARTLRRDFEVTTTSDPRRVFALCEETRFDALVTDLEMPHLRGEQLISRLHDVFPDRPFPIIVITGTLVNEVEGASVVLHKPDDVENVVAAVTTAIAAHSAIAARSARGDAEVVA